MPRYLSQIAELKARYLAAQKSRDHSRPFSMTPIWRRLRRQNLLSSAKNLFEQDRMTLGGEAGLTA
jgi:hypothetical protein